METIQLDHPITVDGKQITEIKLRRPKVSDIVAAKKSNKSDAEQEVAIIANLSMQSPETIMELDVADYGKLQKVLAGFFD
jgi:hypothetical protein